MQADVAAGWSGIQNVCENRCVKKDCCEDVLDCIRGYGMSQGGKQRYEMGWYNMAWLGGDMCVPEF